MQKFTGAGVFVTKWGTGGVGDGQFKYPCGVAVDGSGNIYVTDTDNNRMQKFAILDLFVTPEVPFGTVSVVVSIIAAVATYTGVKRLRFKTPTKTE